MLDLLSIGTNRGHSMIGVGISAGLSGAKRARSIQDPLPALDLDWATDRSLPAAYGPTPSFSRASSGTFFNSSGVLTTAAVNGPRFNHTYNGSSWVSKGLLVEEQRTNILQYSEDISYGGWTKTDASVSVNSGIAPDGNMTADKLVENTASGVTHRMYYSLSMGTSSTFSAFFKAAGRNYVMMMIYPGTAKFAYFDILNGSVVSTNAPEITAKVQPVGNGWFRCSVTYSGASISSFVQIHMSPDGITDTYNGDGTSGMFIWGLQAENNVLFPTSYIPTTTAAATRSADVCHITGTDFSSFWNASEGSWALEADSIGFASTGSNRFFYAAQSGGVAFYSLDIDPTLGLEYRVYNSSMQAQLTHTQPNAGVLFKHSLCYKVNDFASSLNGSAVATDTSGTLPTATSLGVGYFPGFNQHGNCHIARLRYYPVRLPNATLQELST